MGQKTLCHMEFTSDHMGQEILLKDGKFQVMMEWEKPYMQACINALQPQGHVLEIGFGCGYAADHIQTYQPKSHTIIEYHPVIAKKARDWAQDKKNVFIVEDTWQHALENLGYFDAVFFDDYPLESEAETKRLAQAAKEAPLLVQEGTKLLEGIYQTYPQLHTLSYQKEDILFFLNAVAIETVPNKESLVSFFVDLQVQGRIDSTTLEYALKMLVEQKIVDLSSIENVQHLSSPSTQKQMPNRDGRLFQFLEECFMHHMQPGSVFSCYLESGISKFEDPLFLEKIINNPFMDYKEHEINVDVPSHCLYFTGTKALVITIKKLG